MDTNFNLMQIKSYYGGPVQTKTKFDRRILSEVATLNLSKISSVVWRSTDHHGLLTSFYLCKRGITKGKEGRNLKVSEMKAPKAILYMNCNTRVTSTLNTITQ